MKPFSALLASAVLAFCFSTAALAAPLSVSKVAAGAEGVRYLPEDGAVVDINPPRFVWWPEKGAVEYLLQVSTSADFATTVVQAVASHPFYAPTEAVEPGMYYWRYLFHTAKAKSGWSRMRSFTVADDAARLVRHSAPGLESGGYVRPGARLTIDAETYRKLQLKGDSEPVFISRADLAEMAAARNAEVFADIQAQHPGPPKNLAIEKQPDELQVGDSVALPDATRLYNLGTAITHTSDGQTYVPVLETTDFAEDATSIGFTNMTLDASGKFLYLAVTQHEGGTDINNMADLGKRSWKVIKVNVDSILDKQHVIVLDSDMVPGRIEDLSSHGEELHLIVQDETDWSYAVYQSHGAPSDSLTSTPLAELVNAGAYLFALSPAASKVFYATRKLVGEEMLYSLGEYDTSSKTDRALFDFASLGPERIGAFLDIEISPDGNTIGLSGVSRDQNKTIRPVAVRVDVTGKPSVQVETLGSDTSWRPDTISEVTSGAMILYGRIRPATFQGPIQADGRTYTRLQDGLVRVSNFAPHK